ncbi:MAG: GAF and ANTAR domain-containing protein [Nakamurella sp.]
MAADRTTLLAAQRDIALVGHGLAGLGGMCAPCVRALPISGVAISTLGGSIASETVCASDDVAFRIDELQFDLGEGPCWEAFASRQPILVPDVRGEAHPHWPVFGDAVLATDAFALFAFPLYVGTTGIGSLGLYRTTAGPLDEQAFHDAQALANTVSTHLLRRILAAAGDGGGPGAGTDPWQDSPHDRREIHQATGIIMNQLDLPVGAAFARLRGHAFAIGQTMAEVAHDVVTRHLQLTGDLR